MAIGLQDEARPSPPTKTGLSPIQQSAPPPPPLSASVVTKTHHSHVSAQQQHRTSPAPTPPSAPSPAAAVGGGVPLPSPSPKGMLDFTLSHPLVYFFFFSPTTFTLTNFFFDF